MRSFPDSTSWNATSPTRNLCNTRFCDICCTRQPTQSMDATTCSQPQIPTKTLCATYP